MVALPAQRPWPVATLAADGRLQNLHPVKAPPNRLGPARMTNQAALAGLPLKAYLVGLIVAGRHSPLALGAIPGDGGLHQETVRLDEVGERMVPRTDDILHGILRQQHFLLRRRALRQEQLAMPHLAVLAASLVAPLRRGMVEVGIGGLAS